MSAAIGYAKQEDRLKDLLALANLKADDIAAAGDETRRQMRLTQEEEAKVTEARAYISKYSLLSANLQVREDALAAILEAHNKDVKDIDAHKAHVASENTRLETFSASLDAREQAIIASEKRSADEAKRVSTLSLEQDKKYQELVASVQSEKNTNTAVAKANVSEDARLKEWESTLKGKAQRLREQAANF